MEVLRMSQPPPADDNEDAAGRPPVSPHPPAGRPEPAGSQPAGSQSTGSEPTGSEPTGSEPTGSEPTGSEPTGSEPTGSVPTGAEDAERTQRVNPRAVRPDRPSGIDLPTSREGDPTARDEADAGTPGDGGTRPDPTGVGGGEPAWPTTEHRDVPAQREPQWPTDADTDT